VVNPVPVAPLSGPTGDLVLQVWTTAMLGLWSAGLWTLRVVLVLEDRLLTPDLSEGGPASAAYRVTFWLAAALAGLLLLVQIGLVLLRRDARSLGAALWGCGKFVVVWAVWLAYGAAVVAACGGLTRALLRELLRVDRWSDWQPGLELDLETAVDATVATVLGLLGLVLWLAALGHVLLMVTRAATLLVLAAVTPVAAAGLVGEAGRSWFWKSVRWFHAAALTPVLVALLIGVGVQTTSGVAAELADGPARAVGTALPGVLLILVSCFAPMALFRLLAFVDPATPAGVQVRQAVNDLVLARSLLTQPGFTPPGGDGSTTGSPDQDPADQRRAEAQDQLGTTAAPVSTSATTGPPVTMPSATPGGASTGTDGAGSPPRGPGPAPSGPLAADSQPRPGGTGSGPAPGPVPGGAASGPSAGSSVAGEAAALPVVPV
jgi:type IV secretion system protein TrbL